MDLFVVNRHIEENETYPAEEEQKKDENEKLQKLFKKIERNKKLRSKQRDKEATRKFAKQKTIESREIKRKIKASIVPVPENTVDDFIGEEATENKDERNEDGKLPKKKTKLIPKSVDGFTILGTESLQAKKNVKRVLPNWLANPTVIATDLQKFDKKISDIKVLDKGLRKLLQINGIKHLFPVQAEVIPWLIKVNKHADIIFPRDVCVSAPTGSGKTLAFVLPVIQALKSFASKQIRALVILPTQDLALQVYKSFKIYSQNTHLEVCLVAGNNSFAVEQSQLVQKNKAFGNISKVDILVCTAGRLVDHLKFTEGFNLQHLEFLIIDEADRVLEHVQNDWLYHLEKHIQQDADKDSQKIFNLFTLQKPRPPQKLLFSATLSQDPEKLNKLSLFQPKLFTSIPDDSKTESIEKASETFIGKYTTPKELTEKYIITSLDLKPLCLYKFIEKEKLTRSLVFTHSVESAHRLTILLQSLLKKDLNVENISSQLQGKDRAHLIEKFSNGTINILVCTDALARGIDLPNVQCVISYSAPKHLKTYIHRVGRTARAGEPGLAVTLLSKQQLSKFKAMLVQGDKINLKEVKIAEEELEPLGEHYKQSLQELKNVVEKEERLDLKKTISVKGANRLKRKRKFSKSDTANE